MARKDPRLSRASAYWRLARKAQRAGNYALAKQYTDTADRLYAAYRRERDRRAPVERTVSHVDYPHQPGTLYDCPACEASGELDPR